MCLVFFLESLYLLVKCVLFAWGNNHLFSGAKEFLGIVKHFCFLFDEISNVAMISRYVENIYNFPCGICCGVFY